MSIKITSGQIIKDVKLLEVDNIRIDNNTISTLNVDNDIILDPGSTSRNIYFGSNLSAFTTIRLNQSSSELRVSVPAREKNTVLIDGTGNPAIDSVSSPWILSVQKNVDNDTDIITPVVTLYDLNNNVKNLYTSNLQLNGQTLSSRYGNDDIILDPSGTGNVKINSGNLVLAAGSQIYVGNNVFTSEDTLDANITATVAVGALAAGNTLTQGSNITTILKALLQKIYYPDITSPLLTITAALDNTPTSPVGSTTSKVEIGTNSKVILTTSFSRGSITGKNNASGVWESGTFQNFRSGAANIYTLNSTVLASGVSTLTTSNVTIHGSNTWTGSVTYLVGPQPTDSTGANYLSPLPAGTDGPRTSSAITGVRAFFYGALSSTNVALANSSQIRSNLTSSINWSSGSPANGQTLALSVPSGTKQVVFAYPDSGLRGLTTVIDSGTGYNVAASFGQYSSPGVQSSQTPYVFGVNGASSYVSIDYKIYIYIPSGPIVNPSTYTFTI